MAARKPTRQWRRWHRWLGLLVAVPVLVLSVTGVLLNHIDALGWSDKPLPLVLARWYGAPIPDEVQGVRLERRWYSQSSDRLFIDDRNAFYCHSPFKGVARDNGLVVVGCGDELLLLNNEGQEVERLGPAYGVPAFAALGRIEGAGLGLETRAGVVHFNVDQLASRPLKDRANWRPARLGALPDDLKTRILSQSVPPSLNWQRLLLDAHSGRILGLAGQLVMDLAALLLSILAITGTVIWARSRR